MRLRLRRLKSRQQLRNLPAQVGFQSLLRQARHKLRAASQMLAQFQLPFSTTSACTPGCRMQGARKKCRKHCCVYDLMRSIHVFFTRSHRDHGGETLCSRSPVSVLLARRLVSLRGRFAPEAISPCEQGDCLPLRGTGRPLRRLAMTRASTRVGETTATENTEYLAFGGKPPGGAVQGVSPPASMVFR